MKERAQHRRAFDQYLRLGGLRSLEQLHALLAEEAVAAGSSPPTLRTLENWSSALHWQDRLVKLEQDAAEQDRGDQIKAIREMNERHAREGVALQQKGIERLQTLEVADIKASDAIRGVTEGARLERIARGGKDMPPAEGDEYDDDIELRSFTEEELRGLAEVAGLRAAGAGEAESGYPP